MLLKRLVVVWLVSSALLCSLSRAQTSDGAALAYGRWEHGIPNDSSFFPIAVWLQSPRNAMQYRKAGINIYVGLWRGPTEDQLKVLKQAGMKVICDQKDAALNSANADVIVGWMHGDEPDNAQSRRDGKGYDPPILPSVIEKNYERLRARDPTRPVLLNLGQGVAFDNYIGRGTRRNHPEDYAEYIRGCDIVSFDIYPAVHDHPEVAGKLEFVARGVERLRSWSQDRKVVWNCIECSRISNTKVKPTPLQIRAEVWMSLIHGSRGIIYFVHQFEPTSDEASLLRDPELLAAVTTINQQLLELAPVLNSRTIDGAVSATCDATDGKVATMCKRYGDSIYLFAVNMTPQKARATFKGHQPLGERAEVLLDEGRTLALTDHRFEDDFDGYAVHCYRIRQ